MNWNIAGHKRQIEFLERAIEKKRIAHAYIFAGPEGVGKKAVARKLAEALLTPQTSSLTPDLIELDGKEGIKIDAVRELIYKLSLKPYSAPYKVAIIDYPENMTDEAQNAMLKTIEEPTDHTVIILITSAPDKLAKTIYSRAQKINFGIVDYEEYKHLLPKKLSVEQKALIQDLAPQRPGLALKIAFDEGFLESLTRIERQMKSFLSSDVAERLLLVNELAESESDELEQTFDLWQDRLESDLRREPKKQTAHLLSLLNESRRMLNQNINSKLMLTNLMLNA